MDTLSFLQQCSPPSNPTPAPKENLQELHNTLGRIFEKELAHSYRQGTARQERVLLESEALDFLW